MNHEQSLPHPRKSFLVPLAAQRLKLRAPRPRRGTIVLEDGDGAGADWGGRVERELKDAEICYWMLLVRMVLGSQL